MTVREARDLLRTLADEGSVCPCCTQTVKVYRRKLTSAAARGLISLYRMHGREWGHLPTVVKKLTPDIAHQGGYVSLAGYWGLMEEERTVRRDDGGRAGFWRVTNNGEAWIRRRVTVSKYARVYDGRVLNLTGDLIWITDALGTDFDYRELMEGL